MSQTFRRIYAVLTPRERKRFFLVVAAVLVMATLEVIGIGAIAAFMRLLSDPALISEHEPLAAAYQALGADNPTQFLVFAGIGLLAVYLFKNAFAVFTVWLQLRFVWNVLRSLTQRLLDSYLSMPWTWHLGRNSSDLQKNLLSEANHVVNGVVMPAIQLMTNTVVLCAILALLLWADPRLALFMFFALGGIYLTIYLAIRHRLAAIGEDRANANRLRYKVLSETFGSIKELKVLGRERYFSESFRDPLDRFVNRSATNQFLGQTPRYLVEGLAFGGVLALIILLVAAERPFAEVIPIATLYVVSGYRILPAMQLITKSLSSLRFNYKSLELISADLPETPAPVAQSFPCPQDAFGRLRQSIELRGISFAYPGAETRAITDLSLSIDANSCVGIAGASGSGKSTLTDILMGVLRPTQGTMSVDGIAIDEGNTGCWQRQLGYVPQQIQLMDDTVTRNIAFAVHEDDIDLDAVHRAARMANILEFIENDLPDGFDTVIGERGVRLSGGQRQRIAIARALYHDPPVLVLDEATSALDSVTEQAITRSIRELSGTRTLIIVAHRLTTIRECDVIHVMDEGRIIASNRYEALIRDCDPFRKLARVAA